MVEKEQDLGFSGSLLRVISPGSSTTLSTLLSTSSRRIRRMMLFRAVERCPCSTRTCPSVWHLIVFALRVELDSSVLCVEVAEAIIWNHEKNCFIGIFNSSDLIKAVLMQINMHRHHPDKVNDILLININTYRGLLWFSAPS